jgi:hypothetical protein
MSEPQQPETNHPPPSPEINTPRPETNLPENLGEPPSNPPPLRALPGRGPMRRTRSIFNNPVNPNPPSGGRLTRRNKVAKKKRVKKTKRRTSKKKRTTKRKKA